MNSKAPIPNELYSPDLVNLAIIELTRYMGAVRNAETRKSTLPEPPSGLARVFTAMGVKPSSHDDLQLLKQALNDFLAKSPVVNVILAETPTSSVKFQLTSWFRSQISPNILLNFSARSDIGGGAILQVGSRIYDFSFKHSLLANKSRIAELVNV